MDNPNRAIEILKDIQEIKARIANDQLALTAKKQALRDECGLVMADDSAAAAPAEPATKRIRLSDEDAKRVDDIIIMACKAAGEKGLASGGIGKALEGEGWKAGENLPTSWMTIVKDLVKAGNLKQGGKPPKGVVYIFKKH